MKPPHDMGDPSEHIIPDKPMTQNLRTWHRRVRHQCYGCNGAWSIDASRYARESLRDRLQFFILRKMVGWVTNCFFKEFINKNEIQSGSGDKAPLEWRQKV